MRPSVVATLLVATIAIAAPVSAQSADEGTRAAARVIGEEGLALFARGDYAGALAKFDRAEALVPVPTLGVRAGRCLQKLGRWVEASERWLRTTTMTIDPSLPELYREAQAQAQVQAREEREALLPRIPTLEVTIAGASADEVTVDGVAWPMALLGQKRPIDPGDHLVRARAGAALAEKRVTVVESSNASVALELAPAFTSRSAASAAPRADSPPVASPLRTIGWIGIGVGAAGIVAGAVTYGLAVDREGDLQETGCFDARCPSSTSEGDVDTYNALVTTYPIAFVAGGVLAAAGAALVVFAPRPAQAKRGALVPVVSATHGGAFAGARGAF